MKRISLAVIALLLTLFSTSAAADVALSVTNRQPSAQTLQPVSGGVPFARGALVDATRVTLLANGSELPAQFLATAHWPDGSVRWLLVDTELDLAPSSTVAMSLATGHAAAAFSGVSCSDSSAVLVVSTGAAQFQFTKAEFLPRGVPFEAVSGGTTYRATPSSWTIEENGAMKAVVRVDGTLQSAGGVLGSNLVGFRARMTFFRNHSDVRVALTFRNNSGVNWDGGRTRGPDVVLSEIRFGIPLAGSGPHTFGPGVEKTWRMVLPASGTPLIADTRYEADGRVAAGWSAPDPLLVATPAYYASTKAWGAIALPPASGGDMQAEFARFEQIQRAKVIAADVENPPNLAGTTVWTHLAADLSSWNDYGDLRWDGNGCGMFSGNHYDWSYGMYLQFMRSGRIEFADAARVFAAHEIDFDVYHTGDDGPAYNYQKNWEDRATHDSPENCFGGGRPTHTWTQGYALHWLMTGDRRGLDAFNELQEGIRQYLYESFVVDGHPNTNEIRTQGWITDNLVARYRIEPNATLATPSGPRTIPQAIKDALQNVFDREAAAGSHGFVYASPAGSDENAWDVNLRAPLQNAYFIEPAIKACDEVFRSADPAYGATLFALVRRMTDFLMSVTYGGDTNASGQYRPRQIPFFMDARQPADGQNQGQVPYLLMSANAAGFVYSETADAHYRDYARAAFRDYVRYVGAIGGDTYGDPNARTPASYDSAVFTGTESKIHGWSSRFGQYYLASEQGTQEPGRRRAVRK